MNKPFWKYSHSSCSKIDFYSNDLAKPSTITNEIQYKHNSHCYEGVSNPHKAFKQIRCMERHTGKKQANSTLRSSCVFQLRQSDSHWLKKKLEFSSYYLQMKNSFSVFLPLLLPRVYCMCDLNSWRNYGLTYPPKDLFFKIYCIRNIISQCSSEDGEENSNIR